MMDIQVEHVEYHRNGISGAGFFTVTFGWEGRRMLGVVFDHDTDEQGECRVAVLDRDALDCTNEEYRMDPYGPMSGVKNWRGDHFADDLYAAIRTATEAWEIRNYGHVISTAGDGA